MEIPVRIVGVVPLIVPSSRIVAPDGVDFMLIDPVETIRGTDTVVVFPGLTVNIVWKSLYPLFFRMSL